MKLLNHIILFSSFILFLKDIQNSQCLYIEKFISNNSSSKSYSSENPPSAVYNGKSVFDSQSDVIDPSLSAFNINDNRVGWAVPESIEDIMKRQCGNKIYNIGLDTCLKAFAANERAMCLHCKTIKVVNQFHWGIWLACKLEAECYNEYCELVNSSIETYGSYVSNYLKIDKHGRIIETDNNNFNWAPLAEICDGSDDYRLGHKNNTV